MKDNTHMNTYLFRIGLCESGNTWSEKLYPVAAENKTLARDIAILQDLERRPGYKSRRHVQRITGQEARSKRTTVKLENSSITVSPDILIQEATAKSE